jgi:hypothetical protein
VALYYWCSKLKLKKYLLSTEVFIFYSYSDYSWFLFPPVLNQESGCVLWVMTFTVHLGSNMHLEVVKVWSP